MKSNIMDMNLKDVYLFKLVRASQAFKISARNTLLGHGVDLTSDQWIVLKRINEKEGISQRELANDVNKDPASVTRILDGLNKKNLIARRQGDDRRIFSIYLTGEGDSIVKKATLLAVDIRKAGLEGLSQKEIDIFSKALDQVYSNFTE